MAQETCKVRDTEYIKADGVACLICKSKNIEGESFKSVTEVSVGQDICCLDCGSTWTDIYYLSTVNDVRDLSNE